LSFAKFAAGQDTVLKTRRHKTDTVRELLNNQCFVFLYQFCDVAKVAMMIHIKV
jgi:hypothetical protein